MTPIRCGVSDGALLIAGELEAGFGIKSAIVALSSSERPSLRFPIVYCAPEELLDACLSLSGGRNGHLLVHLSGYGYSPDGAPALLADALEKVRLDGRFHVAVFFHELFASGMPWRSAFWYSQRQKKAIRRIAEACDLAIANTRGYVDWLERETTRRSALPIRYMPVFSQVGEAQQPAPVIQRDPVVVVFGQSATRQRAYRKLTALKRTLRRLAIREILDIGPECDAPPKLGGISVRRLGMLAGQDVAKQLSQTMFGFFPYPAVCLAKSGVFAAYCAHGVIPIVARQFSGEVDGLKDGAHVLSSRTAKTSSSSDLEMCAAAAWRWYSGHRLHDHGAIYARWLREIQSGFPAIDGENE